MSDFWFYLPHFRLYHLSILLVCPVLVELDAALLCTSIVFDYSLMSEEHSK